MSNKIQIVDKACTRGSRNVDLQYFNFTETGEGGGGVGFHGFWG